MKLSKTILSVCVVALVCSCGTLKTFRAGKAQKGIAPPEGELSGYGEHLATKFGLMSLFAEAVYRRTYDSADPNATISTCGDSESKDSNFLMPWAIQNGGKYTWNRLFNAEATGAEPCFAGGGLYYETYVLRDDNGKMLEAVIAYRGTDGFANDMKTNLSAAVGLEPPQYADAKIRLGPLVKYLSDTSANIKIYAVGHSLGGGLAQQAGYLSDKISEVYAFNTSPITNWSSIALAKDNGIGIGNHYPVIYRLNHGGEGLGPVRYISTLLTSARFNRYDIDFQITDKKAISGHAMRIISCRLAEEVKLLSNKDLYAEHYFGIEFIDQYMIENLSQQTNKVPVCRQNKKKGA